MTLARPGPLSEPALLQIELIEKAQRMQRGDLLRVMQIESAVSSTAMNADTKAVGPIQFMPSTLKQLGYLGTPEEFSALPFEKQLPFVRRYFASRGQLPTLADVYAAVFWPAAVGKPDDYVISGDSHSIVYRLNATLDVNGDGKILKGELDPACRKFLRGSRWRAIEKQYGLTPEPETSVVGTTFWLQSCLAALGFYHGEVDGIAGPKTAKAVADFQKSSTGLKVDGIVGFETLAALKKRLNG